jgi:hypothetical protein
MSASESPSRIILAHAGREAFSEMSRSILSKLGYVIVPPEDFDACAESLGRDCPDLRIVGAVQRPAGMHELYRVIQEVLEDTPRSAPRLPVHLRAHCSRDGHEWTGTLLSLSEGGCLLRSTAPQNLGVTFTLRFSLPRTGPLVLDAEVTYQLVPDLGLTFQSTSPTDRESITNFIQRSLLDS